MSSRICVLSAGWIVLAFVLVVSALAISELCFAGIINVPTEEGTIAEFTLNANDGCWVALGSGTDGAGVYTLGVYSGQLIAGGQFSTAGGVPANKIAAWDRSYWSALALGLGVTGEYVYAITAYSSQLIAGGSFRTAGSVPVERVAVWDGSSWSALGGLNGWVFALTVYNGLPVAGGRFDDCVRAWNGNSWLPVGLGVSDQLEAWVDALIVYNGQLIVGGRFTSAGSVSVSNIAAWDGSSWHPLGSGVWGQINSLSIYKEQLIAGGQFTSAGGVPVSNIAAWDGNSWSPLGSGMNSSGRVHSLVAWGDLLVAAGDFFIAGDLPCKNIAAWDGNTWTPLDSGIDGSVYALAVYNDQLIVGGGFSSAGGIPANNIVARNWDTDGDGVPDIADNCLSIRNPAQEDADGDGIGDSCDVCTDTDLDGFGDPGFPANTCVSDNCPDVPSPDQEDNDQDGIGNLCDPCDCTHHCDVNLDEAVNPVDVVIMVNFVYKDVDARQLLTTTCPYSNGDWNCSGWINPVDVVAYVNFVYKQVGAPCDPCGPSGSVLGWSDCKSSALAKIAAPPDQDCVEYQYDGQSVLSLKHVNAGFNCCPAVILADIDIQGGIITITESERLDPGCKCLCLYDVDYEITNLPPGVYTIRVNGMYLQEGDQPLEFVVDLGSSPSGEFCVPRTHYPWGTP